MDNTRIWERFSAPTSIPSNYKPSARNTYYNKLVQITLVPEANPHGSFSPVLIDPFLEHFQVTFSERIVEGRTHQLGFRCNILLSLEPQNCLEICL